MRVPHLFLLTLALTVTAQTFGQGECSPPAQPGIRICTPTPNSTVVYVPLIAVNTTPDSAPIYKFIIYDNDVNIFEGVPYQTGINLFDAGMRNGPHRVVVNAWDTTGRLFQARVNFNEIGQGYPIFCNAPASPGINFCVPPANSVQSLGVPVSATATGYTKITAIQAYLDGQLQNFEEGNNYLSTSVSPSAPGEHTVMMVAWDSTGHRFWSSKKVLTSYDYLNCPPKGNAPCIAGFVINAPFEEAYVDSSFPVQATIENNPLPITKMVLYIDSTQVADSNGPTMSQSISNTPSGTHILTFQAWDTAGHLYRVQQNININVPH
jgi:hypothetical protein